MKYILILSTCLYNHWIFAQSVADNETPNVIIVQENQGLQVYNHSTKIDSNIQVINEEFLLEEELKSKGLQNFMDDNIESKEPVKYYIVLKAFNNESMAKKYIESLVLKGIKSVKLMSEKEIHRVYHAVTYKPEEANKLIEVAKTIESEAWIMEKAF